jgi:hypothetical protein
MQSSRNCEVSNKKDTNKKTFAVHEFNEVTLAAQAMSHQIRPASLCLTLQRVHRHTIVLQVSKLKNGQTIDYGI